jgi:hypothetical protein
VGRRGTVLIALGGLAITSAVAVAIAARPQAIELPAVRSTWGAPPPSLVPPSAPGHPDVEFQRYLGGPSPAEIQAGFVVLPPATPVPPALAREIVRAILDPAVYHHGIGCLFQPGVAIRFRNGSRVVDAIICFHCGDVKFQPMGEAQSILNRLAFDKERLLALVRRARPGDARLAQLK